MLVVQRPRTQHSLYLYHPHVLFYDHPLTTIVTLSFPSLRGDNIAVIAELDETLDAGQDLSSIRACPLKPVTH